MNTKKILKITIVIILFIVIINPGNIFAVEEFDNDDTSTGSESLDKDTTENDNNIPDDGDIIFDSDDASNDDDDSDDNTSSQGSGLDDPSNVIYIVLNKKAKDNLIINVSWSKVDNASFYLIHKRSNSGKLLQSVKLNANTLSYDFKNLSNNTVYKFEFEAYKIENGKNVLIAKSYEDLVGTKARRIAFNESDYRSISSFSASPTKVKINLRTKLKEGKTGYNIVQGGCSDGKYAYYLLIKKSNQKGRILKVRISDTKVVKRSGVISIKHGNGMACDTKHGRLVISGNGSKRNKLALVDSDTLEFIKNVKISYTYLKYSKGWGVKKPNGKYYGLAAISYVKKFNIYIGLQKITHDLLVLDSDFKVVGFISTDVNKKYPGLYQDMDADERYVYLLLSPYNNIQPNNIMLVLDYNSENLLNIINGEVNYLSSSYKANNLRNGSPDAVIRLNNPNEAENIYHVSVGGKNHFFVSEYKNKAKYHWVKKKKKVRVKWKKVKKRVKYKVITKSGKVKYKYKKKKVWKYKTKYKKVKVYEFHYYKKDGYVYDLGIF